MVELARFQNDFASRIDGSVPAPAALQVYRNTILLGAVDALADNFPVTRLILGERDFERLAIAHARLYPPFSPVLADYGRLFPSWLATQPIAGELPYLADISTCERLWVEALCAADVPVLDIMVLEGMEPDSLLGLRLKLHPAARFAWLATPAMAIWLAHQGELSGEIEPDWQSSGALFTRLGRHVEGGEIDAPTHRMLAGLSQGETLGEAAAAAQQFHSFADVGASLTHLVQRGVFVALAH